MRWRLQLEGVAAALRGEATALRAALAEQEATAARELRSACEASAADQRRAEAAADESSTAFQAMLQVA